MKRRYLKDVLVNNTWIQKNIKSPGWQRNIYPANVNKFLRDIKDGFFTDNLITLAKVKGDEKMILLDGQHRIEAIKKSKQNFKMDLKIYEGLTDEEMRIKYKVIGTQKAHRIPDDLRLYLGRHKILDKFLEKEFPITITLEGGVNAMRLDILVKVVLHSDMKTISRQGITRNNLKKVLNKIDSKKYKEMKEFFSFYRKCFGDPHKQNWLYKHVLLVTLVKVWKANRIFYDEEEMVEHFREIEGNALVRQGSHSVDSPTLERMTKKIYQVINKGRKGKRFLIFWED